MPPATFTLVITTFTGERQEFQPIMRVIVTQSVRDGQMTTLGPFVMN